jgi:hypothetical protein
MQFRGGGPSFVGRVNPPEPAQCLFVKTLIPERDANRPRSIVPGFASSVISASAASLGPARTASITRPMAAGENKLGVPPPMKTLEIRRSPIDAACDSH